MLVRLWNHPRVVKQGSPVGVDVGIGSRTQHLKVEQVRLVGVDGDVKRNGTGFVGVVLRGRTQQFTAFVSTCSEAVRLAASCRTKVNVPVEVAADDARAVRHLFPFHGDVAVGRVDVLQFKRQEVRGGVGCLVQVLKADLANEVDVLSRFSSTQGLRCTDAVLQLKGGDACIVFHGVADRRFEQHSVGKSVHAVGGCEPSVHTNSRRVVPGRVNTEVPGDLLTVGDVRHRGRGFELDVVVLVAGFSEGHEVAPREFDVTRFGLKGQPGLSQRSAGQGINSVCGDHFVDVAVGVQAHRVVGEGQRVAVSGAGRDAQVTQHHTATG